MEQFKNKQTIISIIASLSLAIAVLLLPLIIVAKTFPIYRWQFSVNKTYDEFGSIELTDAKGREIIQYMNGEISSLDAQFFSEQARIHMFDVQYLFFFAKIITLFCTIVFLVFLWSCLINQHYNFLGSTLIKSGVSINSILILVAIGIVFFWDTLFIKFHTTFFSNDYWLFPPSDSLIRLFPEQFFITLSSIAICGGLLLGSSCILCGLLLKKKLSLRYTKTTQ